MKPLRIVLFTATSHGNSYLLLGERKTRPRGDRKSIEMTLHLQQTFEAAIMTQLYPKSQIDIFVEVRESKLNSFIKNDFLPFG